MAKNFNFVACSLLLALFSLFLLAPPSPCHAHILKFCKFNAIYQLGDSISDTGNLIRESPQSPFARLPYGETIFNKATGRCSNGLLMIDYIALSAGVPLLDAYLNLNATHSHGHGVNFAVAGSTALPVNVLLEKRILAPVTNSSLNTQLDWMFTYFNETCPKLYEGYCYEKLKRSLFMVGEIGGNDYNYALFQGKTLEEVKAMVPDVVQAIKDAATRVIENGARRVIIPGNFPIGCFPIYLTGFQTNDSTAYDELHCLKGLNNFSMYHNECLQQAIQELKLQYPNVAIVYGDYYNAFLWLLRHACLLRFDVKSVQKACCGVGGEYDFSLTRMCGAPNVPVCGNPHERISWDGVHLTQKAYKIMASWLIRHIFPKLQCFHHWF
ncbi:GDSL esterase/lipase At5g03980-like [Pistacia vera]|uniref:GDSL esterase/lipase At5g03980-like n=1 Tax=Pistacia vera TaxID=55513 RepID=UPI001262B486|nr:GDSL esterase/lipase At5g03980-like [Pistacia vera]